MKVVMVNTLINKYNESHADPEHVITTLLNNSIKYWDGMISHDRDACVDCLLEILKVYGKKFFSTQMDCIKRSFSHQTKYVEQMQEKLQSLVKKMILYVHFQRKMRWMDQEGKEVSRRKAVAEFRRAHPNGHVSSNGQVCNGNGNGSGGSGQTNNNYRLAYTNDSFPQVNVKIWSHRCQLSLPMPKHPLAKEGAVGRDKGSTSSRQTRLQ